MPRQPSDPPFYEQFDRAVWLVKTEFDHLSLDEHDDECIDAVANFAWGVQEVINTARRLTERAKEETA